MPCYAMLCYAMPCHAMLYAMPCYAMLCYEVTFAEVLCDGACAPSEARALLLVR